MTEKDTAKVVVVRCADLPTPTVDSDVRNCTSCGEPCWASKNLTNLETTGQFERVDYSCQVCTPIDELLKKPNVSFLESQRAELESKVGSWGVTLLLAQLGITEIEADK